MLTFALYDLHLRYSQEFWSNILHLCPWRVRSWHCLYQLTLCLLSKIVCPGIFILYFGQMIFHHNVKLGQELNILQEVSIVWIIETLKRPLKDKFLEAIKTVMLINHFLFCLYSCILLCSSSACPYPSNWAFLLYGVGHFQGSCLCLTTVCSVTMTLCS